MALVQSFPQQSGSMTVLQQRPRSTGSLQAIGGLSTSNRDSIQRLGPSAMATYRGQVIGAPVAPYAFLNTPPMNQSGRQKAAFRQSLPPNARTASTGSAPQFQNGVQTLGRRDLQGVSRVEQHMPALQGKKVVPRDDLVIGRGRRPQSTTIQRPKSAILFPSSAHSFDQRPPSASSARSAPRPAADRYRRRSAGPGNATNTIYVQPSKASSSPSLYAGSVRSRASSPTSSASNDIAVPPPVLNQQMRKGSMDDIFAQRRAQLEKARRMRSKSVQSLDRRSFARSAGSPAASPSVESMPRSPFGEAGDRPSILRNNSSDTASVQSRPSSSHSRFAGRFGIRPSSAGVADPAIPDRSSSNKKRMTLPSPLSRPVTSDGLTKRTTSFSKFGAPRFFTPEFRSASVPTQPSTPNSENSSKKSIRSRLRRAFSFSSSSELRRAAVESKKQQDLAAQRFKLNKERAAEATPEDGTPVGTPIEEESLEEMLPPPVLDAGIYQNSGDSFQGSTDNFSVSSTASSASLMMRKMGKSMRRTSRSIKGIFRTKSGEYVEGDEAQRQVIEAECEVVNVNYVVTENPAGETDYPRLERNSIDAVSVSAALDQAAERPLSNDDRSRSLRNLVTGERADGTLIIPKGILKRQPGSDSGNSSPVTPPEEAKAPELGAADTPKSSRPSTPSDEGKVDFAVANDDYFNSAHVAGQTNTESALNLKYNVSFNSRLQFHDTWPSMEYDRRGEIATCNRLTPLLAQQIKEELNTFKMEMEVHESSKMYTHFF